MGALRAVGTLMVPGVRSRSVILNGLVLKIDILFGQVLLNMQANSHVQCNGASKSAGTRCSRVEDVRWPPKFWLGKKLNIHEKNSQ